ncbi:hypothetical protein Tco_0180323 [Tanacetum coccineum]
MFAKKGAKSDKMLKDEQDQEMRPVKDTKTDQEEENKTESTRRQLLRTQANQSILLGKRYPQLPSTVEADIAHKMQEMQWNFAVQLSMTNSRRVYLFLLANQQFLETIDDGMKKIIKEHVKKEVSKIIPKVEKFVNDRLESEVLVRSSKEANSSHARQLYKDLVEAYEADKILLDTYGDTVTIKRPRDGGQNDDEEPSAGTDRGSKRRRSGKEPASTSAPSETTTKTAGPDLPILDVHLKDCTTRRLTQVSQEEQAREKSLQSTNEKLDWINPEGRQYPHDLRQPLPLVPNSQGRRVIPFHHFINNDLEYLRGGVSSQKYSTDDDALYMFQRRLLTQTKDPRHEDMLLLLVQGKVTNLSVEERIAFNVSLRMFTRRVVIQRRVEDLQLVNGNVISKKLNLTSPTRQINLRRQDAYTPITNSVPIGFI